MARERIVVETSPSKKSALVASLKQSGRTLSEWFDEQMHLALPDSESEGKEHEELGVTDPWHFEDLARVERGLLAYDWAHTQANTREFTHDIHPYPAKFIPQIPRQLIKELSVPGALVLDPFGGSGTTALEAIRLRRRAISIDANPIASLVGSVKSTPLRQTDHASVKHLAALTATFIHDRSGSEIPSKRELEEYIPNIPNHEKWFSDQVTRELALIRRLIAEIASGPAERVALVALSRIVTRVSNQDSETRYAARDKQLPPLVVLSSFLESLKLVYRKVSDSPHRLGIAGAQFLTGDSADLLRNELNPESVDLVVSSPPYANANDYHLYHRFRLFWLGFDPRELGKIEIGSHLRHQRSGHGLDHYREEMMGVLAATSVTLRPGGFLALVLGDAVFKGKTSNVAALLKSDLKKIGFEDCALFQRPIHKTKRSFAHPARRAAVDRILVMRRNLRTVKISLAPPSYRMWDYEEIMRRKEIAAALGRQVATSATSEKITVQCHPYNLSNLRRLTFTSVLGLDVGNELRTWQSLLENGDEKANGRKEPKYVTHGIHPYKGKFYPQLAKALINASGVKTGSVVLDPWCGSGTVPLECQLNGLRGVGCDLSPLATVIALAKTSAPLANRDLFQSTMNTLLDLLPKERHLSTDLDQFDSHLLDELRSWFPSKVLGKLNWLMNHIRLIGDHSIREFFLIVLSSIVREVSQQEPRDLRIRRREKPIEDAPVFELFEKAVRLQWSRLIKYWNVCGDQPFAHFPAVIVNGDNRGREIYESLGLGNESVDLVVTSPPYATALPYIDTDRLSFLVLYGMRARDAAVIEKQLTGSREISGRERKELEEEFLSSRSKSTVPLEVQRVVRDIYQGNRNGDAGFRKKNVAALLWRYFSDMQTVLKHLHTLLKPGGVAYLVVGDNRTQVGSSWYRIPTCDLVKKCGRRVGFRARTYLDISVTQENYRHVRNSISENSILELRKAS